MKKLIPVCLILLVILSGCIRSSENREILPTDTPVPTETPEPVTAATAVTDPARVKRPKYMPGELVDYREVQKTGILSFTPEGAYFTTLDFPDPGVYTIWVTCPGSMNQYDSVTFTVMDTYKPDPVDHREPRLLHPDGAGRVHHRPGRGQPAPDALYRQGHQRP